MPITFNWYDLLQELQTLITHRLNSETVCLFQGSHTPGLGDSTFNYLAVECNFGGYRRYPLVFHAAAQNADSIAFTQSQIQFWETVGALNLPQTASGVFALDATLQVAWAELLPQGPVTLAAPSQRVVYQAVVVLPP